MFFLIDFITAFRVVSRIGRRNGIDKKVMGMFYVAQSIALQKSLNRRSMTAATDTLFGYEIKLIRVYDIENVITPSVSLR